MPMYTAPVMGAQQEAHTTRQVFTGRPLGAKGPFIARGLTQLTNCSKSNSSGLLGRDSADGDPARVGAPESLAYSSSCGKGIETQSIRLLMMETSESWQRRSIGVSAIAGRFLLLAHAPRSHMAAAKACWMTAGCNQALAAGSHKKMCSTACAVRTAFPPSFVHVR